VRRGALIGDDNIPRGARCGQGTIGVRAAGSSPYGSSRRSARWRVRRSRMSQGRSDGIPSLNDNSAGPRIGRRHVSAPELRKTQPLA